jgi:hypothetical protein
VIVEVHHRSLFSGASMTHLVPAAQVRASVERVALSARPNAPVRPEPDCAPSRPHAIAHTRSAARKLRERRLRRARRRVLERDLATYTTSAEIEDLLGTIQGQEHADAEVIRGILAGNLHGRAHRFAS